MHLGLPSDDGADIQGVVAHAFVNTEVVKAHTRGDCLRAHVKTHFQRPPQNPPTPHKNAEGALDGHTHGGLHVVKNSMMDFVCRAHHLFARNECSVAVDEEAWWKVSSAEFAHSKGSGVVAVGARRDLKEEELAVGVTDGHAEETKATFAGNEIPIRTGENGKVTKHQHEEGRGEGSRTTKRPASRLVNGDTWALLHEDDAVDSACTALEETFR